MANDRIDEILLLWDYNNPADTEVRFRELIEPTKATGDEQTYVALLTQIARTYSLRSQFDEAHSVLDEVEVLLTSDMQRAQVMYLLERGRAFNSARKISEAAPLFRQAFSLAEAGHLDALTVDAAHMVAIADAPYATRWNLIAMAVAESSKDEAARKWLGSLYNNEGWTMFDQGDYEGALLLFNKAQEFHQASGNIQRWQIARWTVARAHRQLGRNDEALRAQRVLLDEVGDDESQLGYIHEELAELLLLQGNAEAAFHFQQAYEILSKDRWLQDNEQQRIQRLKSLGRQQPAN